MFNIDLDGALGCLDDLAEAVKDVEEAIGYSASVETILKNLLHNYSKQSNEELFEVGGVNLVNLIELGNQGLISDERIRRSLCVG